MPSKSVSVSTADKVGMSNALAHIRIGFLPRVLNAVTDVIEGMDRLFKQVILVERGTSFVPQQRHPLRCSRFHNRPTCCKPSIKRDDHIGLFESNEGYRPYICNRRRK